MEKTIKTISELVDDGWDKNLLYRICHMPNSPAFRSAKRGKFFFRVEALNQFIDSKGVK